MSSATAPPAVSSVASAAASSLSPTRAGVPELAARAVEARGLTRRFGSLVAVDAIDLSVDEGEIFGLLGPNGAGKTTTIRMLITLLKPTAGSAQVAGHDVVRDAQEVRRSIGYVPQLLSADGTLTGYENVLVSARLYHLPPSERRPRIEAALERVGLADVAGHLVREYSGGMIRRLEVAAAMLHRPPVLFLDEPTVGLDPVARDTVWAHIRELRDVEGTTVLLTTHYMEEADELCDRVAIMDHGRIAASGSPGDLKAAIGPDATLDDVFTAHAGRGIDTGGGYRDVARTRRTARRVG
jgi:ABC-2 type transport system ATP-binding protein